MNENICYLEDAQLLIKWVERVHPSFQIGEIAENYTSVREKYLVNAEHNMRKIEFLYETQRFLSILRDGHMGGGIMGRGVTIDIEWNYADNNLRLPNGDEITDIGGKPVTDIYKIINEYFYAENNAARELQYKNFCREQQVLAIAGCIYTDKIIVTAMGRDGEYDITYPFIPPEQVRANTQPAHTIKCVPIDDIICVDMRVCRLDEALDAVCAELVRAVSSGIYKFIFDIRGNSGGDSIAGVRLLESLGLVRPEYGGYSYISEYIKGGRYGEFETDEPLRYTAPNPDTAVRNEKIQLAVLTDRSTYSSATMLGVWVQDGKLGKIIGQPSSNAPSHYGNSVAFMLPVSGQIIGISYCKFLRPDAKADQHTLVPDISVPYGSDALEYARTYLDYL